MTTTMSEVTIWSADVNSVEEVVSTLELFPERIRPKIDRLGQKKMGDDAVQRLSERGFEVFDDAKIIEIPEKMEALAEEHCKSRPWMLNCMAGGVSSELFDVDDKKLRDGLKRFADVCHKWGVRPCGVTVLTSKKANVVEKEFNKRTSIEQVLLYVQWLVEAGFTDLVCSTAELLALAEAGLLDVIDANVPGIRLPDSDSHDQARVGTPHGALEAGAKRLVIGRDLTNDPVGGYKKILANIRGEAA